MKSSLPTFFSPHLPIGSLEAYIQAINTTPILSAEEEWALARQLRAHQDLEAAKKLILANLRYVVRIAYQYRGYGLAIADLIQEGSIGLMKAVKRFDPEQGVRLISFAVHWIKAEMHDFIIRNWRIVKVATTKAQRKLFFNLRKSKSTLGYLSAQEAATAAKELNVSLSTLHEMDMRLNAHDVSFDITPDDETESAFIPSQHLEDARYNPAQLLEHDDTHQQGNQDLHAALSTLDARSQAILTDRWLAEKKSTLQELAEKYQVSAERIRQIEKTAMMKLKQNLATSHEM
ncbi:MAG: RNA polymerase sigma factor RpoH [Gammaproteobacteria bacterium]|nr:RNA polymerase sigma factor RpoH [Gammaproteobacteria bacterium]